MHATLLGNHDDAPYTIRSRPGQVEKHANAKPPPGSTGTTPAAPLPGRHHTTTSRKSTHNNTKGSGLNKPPQNPGFDTPAKGHCTRYVALHPLRRAAPVTWRCTLYVALHPLRRAAPEQKGCIAYRSGAMPTHRVHDPPSQAQMRTCPNGGRRIRQAWLRRAATHPQQPTGPGSEPQQPTGPGSNAPPTTNRTQQRRTPRQPTGPGGNESPTINRPGSNAPPTTNRTRRRRSPNSWLGPAAAGPDRPSRRRAERAARDADNERATERAARGAARHKAWARRSRGIKPGRVAPAASRPGARGTHATSPGPGRAYDEAGTRRAKQRRGPRPRQQVRPGDPP